MRLRSVEGPRVGPLEIYRSYSDQQSHGCYLHPEKLAALGVSAGDRVELFDPDTGGRAITRAQELYPGDHDTAEMIRLGLPLINVLNVGFGDQVCVRTPVDTSVAPSDPRSQLSATVSSATSRLFGSLVGSREVQLKIERGENQDEQREIARMSESTRQYLGVDINDKIRVEWKNRTRTAQCLSPRDGADDAVSDPVSVEPLEVAIPSSFRDAIEVSPDDTVNVQRDTWFVFRKQVSISIIGILGVVFGTFQVMNATGWIDVLVDQFGRTIALVQLLALAGVISLPVLFLIFLPVRGDV